MDILIKGMEMPKNYPYRITIHSDGHVEEHSRYSGHGHYKAISVPEHGRCIDADQLQDVLRLVLSLVVSNELTEKEISLVHRTIGAISEAINSLDTVLEAST